MFPDRHSLLPALAVAVLLSIGGLRSMAPDTASADDQSLEWRLPSTLETTIDVGDTITWTWADSNAHSIKSTLGKEQFSSGVLLIPGSTFSFQFNVPGVYKYKCEIHPSLMTGAIYVGVSPPTPTPTIAPPTSTPTVAPPTPTPGATEVVATPTQTGPPPGIPTPKPPNTGDGAAASSPGPAVAGILFGAAAGLVLMTGLAAVRRLAR